MTKVTGPKTGKCGRDIPAPTSGFRAESPRSVLPWPRNTEESRTELAAGCSGWKELIRGLKGSPKMLHLHWVDFKYSN